MFLSKVQQSYCYIQLYNFREEFVFESINSQSDIVLGCHLSFTRALNASYLEIDE